MRSAWSYFLQFMVLPVGVMVMALVFSFISVYIDPAWLQ